MTAKKTPSNEKRQGRFQKGQPRPPGAGRKPGSRNKITRSVKEAFEAAFKELQEDPKSELTAWARRSKANLREFYKIAARFIPLEVQGGLNSTTTVKVGIHSGNTLELCRRIAFMLKANEVAIEADAARKALAALPEHPRQPVKLGVQLEEKVINPTLPGER